MRIASLLLPLLASWALYAQELPHYTCFQTVQAPLIDGKGDDEVWNQAMVADLVDVSDLTGNRQHAYPTHFRMLWDQERLYVLVVAADQDVWSVLEDRDAHLWNDEVLELFADPDGDEENYLEIEVNSLNTVLDLLKASRRGNSYWDWDPEYLTAVHVEGTINDPSDEDRYWSLEMALPWSLFDADLLDVLGDRALPPQPGDQWRFNIYRYERLRASGEETHIEYSAWSPTGEIDFHRPDRFGIVAFAAGATAVMDFTWGQVKKVPR